MSVSLANGMRKSATMFGRGLAQIPYQASFVCHYLASNSKQAKRLDQHFFISYSKLQRRSLASFNQSSEEKHDEDDKRPPSLIVQKLLHLQNSTQSKKNETRNSRDDVENLSLKLEKLSKDMCADGYQTESERTPHRLSESSSASEAEDSWCGIKMNTDKESFIEDIVLKEDLHNKTKPSPLLGTEDHSVPPSEVPCIGCGALLHCQHRTLPGFMPSERFNLLSESELKSSLCQRCHYIQHCDAFIEVTSNPEDYAEMISKIKPTRSVIVMVVDVMDIPGSIIPNLVQYIGQRHPLVIVGNKMDLIAPDSTDFLVQVKESIGKTCQDAGLKNIRKVALVSAKTGFGIERLINILFSFYKSKVDVFIVGTANAGKSSLFNTLLASDYCRQKARSLIQRATVSVWPGTTLNLLKFPIMQPTPRILNLRYKRLKQETAIRKEFLKQEKLQNKRKEKLEKWELKEDVKTTDIRTLNQFEKDQVGKPWGQEVFAYKGGMVPSDVGPRETFDASHYEHSYWMYDTPGVINPEQTFNLLEPEECRHLQPVTTITPRCLILKPGTALFISGLARLDYIEGREAMMTTVHCGSNLPIRVVAVEEADDYYLQHIGTPEFLIPGGDKSRLDRLPALVGKDIQVEGQDDRTAIADVQLSSVGWVSLAPRAGCSVKLRAFTPGRKGIHLRSPPLLPRFMPFKRSRIPGTPFFHPKQIGLPVIGKVLADEGNEA